MSTTLTVLIVASTLLLTLVGVGLFAAFAWRKHREGEQRAMMVARYFDGRPQAALTIKDWELVPPSKRQALASVQRLWVARGTAMAGLLMVFIAFAATDQFRQLNLTGWITLSLALLAIPLATAIKHVKSLSAWRASSRWNEAWMTFTLQPGFVSTSPASQAWNGGR